MDRQKISLKQFLSLYVLYAKMDFAWLLRDRVFASLAILSDVISNLSSIAGIFLLAWKFGGIGGMSRYEILFMLGYTSLMTGIYQVFFSSNNVGHISRRIGRGQVDHMLMQPLPLPVQLMTEGFIPFSGSSNLVSGAALLCIAVASSASGRRGGGRWRLPGIWPLRLRSWLPPLTLPLAWPFTRLPKRRKFQLM